MILRGHRVAALVLALAATSVGCAGVPSSSSPRIVEPAPKGGVTEEPDIRYWPISPQPGESPKNVVRDFLAAASSPERQHGIARQYLTPAAAKAWRDDAGAVVLAGEGYIAEVGDAQVRVNAQQVGELDAHGSYTPMSSDYQYLHRFDLARVGGEWRILNPPPGVIVTQTAFAQAYRRLNVYFLNLTGSQVVPDPRWFSAPRESLPNLLLSSLLDGPSPALAGAVRTGLDGLQLTSNVVPENDRVRVYLSGLNERGQAVQGAASVQIVWTLNQLGVPGVEIYDDGQALRLPGLESVQRQGDWRTYDPDELPLATDGYYIHGQAVWTTEGRPAAGPAGRPGYRAEAVGVARDMSRLAVVGRVPGGKALYVSSGPQLSLRLSATTLTAPTWGSALDEVWTVRNGTEIVQVPSRGTPAPVTARGIDRLGPIAALRLSRDGSRVAIVAGERDSQALYVGAVIRPIDGRNRVGGVPSIDRLRPVGPLGNVQDVAWSAADTLVVLIRSSSGDTTLSSVAVDGSISDPVTASGLPGPPSAVAAAPKLPLLTVAEGGIWRLRDPRESWTEVARGGQQQDTAPTYPG